MLYTAPALSHTTGGVLRPGGLELTAILVGQSGLAAGEGEWWPLSALDEAGLPTLYRKLVDQMREKDG